MELRVNKLDYDYDCFAEHLAFALLAVAAPAGAHVPSARRHETGQKRARPQYHHAARPKDGMNDNGFFYRVGTDFGTDVTLQDTDGNVFGVFPSGTRVKYTEANGATPSVKKIGSDSGQSGAVDFHITGTGDLVVVSVDGTTATCPVPPPPK